MTSYPQKGAATVSGGHAISAIRRRQVGEGRLCDATPDMPSRIRSAVRAVLFAREPDVHPQLRDRVLKEVLWFATEVPRKYATRYRSVAAWDLQRKGKRVGDWAGLVAHEPVWTRASCRLRLLSAADAKAIEE
jgi:hypothetical protein